MKRLMYLALMLVSALIVGIACSDGGQDGGVSPGGTASPTVQAGSEIDFSSASGIDGGDPEFNFTALIWQGLSSFSNPQPTMEPLSFTPRDSEPPPRLAAS